MKHLQHPTQPPPEELPECTGDTIVFGRGPSGGSGHLARSSRSGPGILVLHDWFGLRKGPRDFADALCSAGFTALAPDLFDGRVASSVQEAEALARDLDWANSRRRLAGAAEFLSANWHPRVGVVGFSLGGALGADLAAAVSIDAVVAYYGLGAPDAATFSAPLLVHLADDDEWTPDEEVRPVVEALERSEVEVDVRSYRAGHWFANPDVPEAFDPQAAGEAWEATVDHLRYHLA